MFISKHLIHTSRFHRLLSSSTSSSSSLFSSTHLPIQSLIKLGIAPSLPSLNQHLLYLCRNHRFISAIHSFTQMKKIPHLPSAQIWDCLIRVLCDEDPEKALFLLRECLRLRSTYCMLLVRENDTFRKLILSFCFRGDVSRAIEALELMNDSFIELDEEKIVLDIGTYMSLVKMVLKERGAAGVLNLIQMIETLPAALYGTICSETIVLLCKSGNTYTAFDLYVMMASNELVASSRAYYWILRGLIIEGEQRVTPLLLNKFVKVHGLTDFLVDKTVVHFLCMKDETSAIKFLRSLKDEAKVTLPMAALTKLAQSGKALNAYNLVKEVANKLPVMDVVDSSIMVDGLCKEGHINIALDLCRFLKKKHGISPNIVTYNSILHGLCRQGCLIEAFRLFDSFERLNLAPTVVTYSILIDALCKEGAFSKAEWLLGKMPLDGLIPNVRTFNSLIDGYCKFGYFKKALDLYYDMQNKGLKSDQFTISAVINGFDLKGDMQGALDFFEDVKRKGESPDFLGFLFLIRGLLTKGRLEEARDILKEMLQTKSVRDSINQVDAEVETESIGSFLVDLCDRGCIKEAVTILDEVGCMLFPLSIASTHKQKKSRTGTEGNASVAASSPNIVRKHSQLQDFNHFYHAIASYCLEGKLQNANNLVKQMLQQFNVVKDQPTEYKLC